MTHTMVEKTVDQGPSGVTTNDEEDSLKEVVERNFSEDSPAEYPVEYRT